MTKMTGARFMAETVHGYGVTHAFFMPYIAPLALKFAASPAPVCENDIEPDRPLGSVVPLSQPTSARLKATTRCLSCTFHLWKEGGARRNDTTVAWARDL